MVILQVVFTLLMKNLSLIRIVWFSICLFALSDRLLAQPMIAEATTPVVNKPNPTRTETLSFDRMLVYEQSDYNGSIVRYQILLNSKTGVMGFDKKLASMSLPAFGDGFTFATGQPDGSYRIYVNDPGEGKVILRYSTGRKAYASAFSSTCRQNFSRRYRPTGQSQQVNGFMAKQYQASLGRKDMEYISVAKVGFNPYPLYLFNELELEAKLPDAHSINFVGRLTSGELLIESKKVYYSELVNGRPAVSTLKLVYYGPMNYSFDATGYRWR